MHLDKLYSYQKQNESNKSGLSESTVTAVAASVGVVGGLAATLCIFVTFFWTKKRDVRLYLADESGL